MNGERRAAENDQFTKVLMVAESPSVAKRIAEAAASEPAEDRAGPTRSLSLSSESFHDSEPKIINFLRTKTAYISLNI